MPLFKNGYIGFTVYMEHKFFCGSLGAIIKSSRLSKGMTQYELADAAGVGRRFVQSVENGHHEVKLSTLFSIAKALGLSPIYLVGELEYAISHGCLPDSVERNLQPKKLGRPKKVNPASIKVGNTAN